VLRRARRNVALFFRYFFKQIDERTLIAFNRYRGHLYVEILLRILDERSLLFDFVIFNFTEGAREFLRKLHAKVNDKNCGSSQ